MSRVSRKKTIASKRNATRAHMSRIRTKEPRRIGNMRPERTLRSR
jgi:hypothetical protein